MNINYPKDTGGGNADWQEHMLQVMKDNKIINVVEFGLGQGSKFIKDNCINLHSIEIVVREEQRGWGEYVQELFKDDTDRFKLTMFDYEDKWDDKLKNKIDRIFLEGYDLAFVDSGSHARGQLVNYCMEKEIPFIMAHDTSHGKEVYGWGLIDSKGKYEKFEYPNGEGTTVWIKK
jgi:hypothetical protein